MKVWIMVFLLCFTESKAQNDTSHDVINAHIKIHLVGSSPILHIGKEWKENTSEYTLNTLYSYNLGALLSIDLDNTLEIAGGILYDPIVYWSSGWSYSPTSSTGINYDYSANYSILNFPLSLNFFCLEKNKIALYFSLGLVVGKPVEISFTKKRGEVPEKTVGGYAALQLGTGLKYHLMKNVDLRFFPFVRLGRGREPYIGRFEGLRLKDDSKIKTGMLISISYEFISFKFQNPNK